MWSFFKMIVWGIMWFFVGTITLFFAKRNQNNCLVWAMEKMDDEGGYLVIRWCRSSKWNWLRWPHFLWLEEKHHEHLQHYVPDDHGNSEKSIPEPWFNGHVKHGDKADGDVEN